MAIKSLKYLLSLSVPLSVFIAFSLGSLWSFFPLVYAFIIIPVLELFLPADTTNLSSEEEEKYKKSFWFDFLVYINVPIQYALLGLYLYNVSFVSLTTTEWVGFTISMGLSCGVLGINVAHELGHRATQYERFMSKMLLLTSLYMHFFVEHNRGHHKNVSTHEDPASSRINEALYSFWFRSIITGYLSAWKLENQRLAKQNQSILSLKNEMIVFTLVEVAFIAGIALLFSWKAALLFMASAVIGMLLLETVNYIEHYGLRRKKIKDSYYEKVMPVHSWNSNHILGRLMLFELSRHSDHHYLASRKYQILRHYEESPQMPTGYPGMMILSLFPPLWFKVMNKKAIDINNKMIND